MYCGHGKKVIKKIDHNCANYEFSMYNTTLNFFKEFGNEGKEKMEIPEGSGGLHKPS